MKTRGFEKVLLMRKKNCKIETANKFQNQIILTPKISINEHVLLYLTVPIFYSSFVIIIILSKSHSYTLLSHLYEFKTKQLGSYLFPHRTLLGISNNDRVWRVMTLINEVLMNTIILFVCYLSTAMATTSDNS